MRVSNGYPVNAAMFAEPERSRQFSFARKGILNPSVETLHPARNAYLYRLGHSQLADDENLSSPWWIDYQNFIALKTFAQANSVSLTVSSRIHSAQAPQFGPADVLYKAVLAAPILVFQGSGRPIMGDDDRVYFPPGAVTQTFVPGLRAWPAKGRSSLWYAAFTSFSTEKLGPGLISLYGE